MSDRDLTPQSPEMIWEMYQGLVSQCQHFNGVESTYRALASTWLLAAFGGIGYILNGNPRHAALLVAAIGGAAALGVVLIWVLDLLVYHSLLVGAFAEQLRLEREHPWLPQAGHLMQAAHGSTSVAEKVAWFYVSAYLLMAGAAAIALAAAPPNLTLAVRASMAAVVFVAAAAPVVGRMRRSARAPTAEVAAYARSSRHP